MVVTEYQIPPRQPDDSGEQKKWYTKPVALLGAGALSAATFLGVGYAVGNGGEKGPAQSEPEAAAPAVPGEEAPAGQDQPTDEAPAIEDTSAVAVDVESYFREPKVYPSGAFAAMNEQEQLFTMNESLVVQSTDYLEAAIAVIEAGGDPSVDISEDLVATVAESRNVDYVTALNDLAAQIVANKPGGAEVTWIGVGALPNELETVNYDNVSSFTRDPDGIIQTYVAVEVEYIPEGADVSQATTAQLQSEFDYAIPVQDYEGRIVFANP